MGCSPEPAYQSPVLNSAVSNTLAKTNLASITPPQTEGLKRTIQQLSCSKGCGRVCNIAKANEILFCPRCDRDQPKFPVALLLQQFSGDLKQVMDEGPKLAQALAIQQRFKQIRVQLDQAQKRFLLQLQLDLEHITQQLEKLLKSSADLKVALGQQYKPHLLTELAKAQGRLKGLASHELKDALQQLFERKAKQLEYPLESIRTALAQIEKKPGSGATTSRLTVHSNGDSLLPYKMNFEEDVLGLAVVKDELYVGLQGLFAKADIRSKSVTAISREYTPSAIAAQRGVGGIVYFMCHKRKACFKYDQQNITRVLGQDLFRDECYALWAEPDDSVYYTDYDGHAVCRLAGGKRQVIFGGRGQGILNGQLSKPYGLVLLGKYIFVSDRGNNRVLSLVGGQIHAVYSMAEGEILQCPRAIVIYGEESILVCEGKGGRRFIRIKVVEGRFFGGYSLRTEGKGVRHGNAIGMALQGQQLLWSEWQSKCLVKRVLGRTEL